MEKNAKGKSLEVGSEVKFKKTGQPIKIKRIEYYDGTPIIVGEYEYNGKPETNRFRMDEISTDAEEKSLDAIKDNFTPPGAEDEVDMTIYKEDEDRFGKDALKGLTGPRESEQLKDEIDTNDNGKIEKDEMADFQKSLDDYAAKNKKGRDDIPTVTTRR